MLNSSRKFIAILMLLWLPVSTGSALAETVSKSLPHSGCPDSVVSHEGMDMDEQQVHQCDPSAPHEDCSCCDICHPAFTGYLSVPGVEVSVKRSTAREITPYLVTFDSVSIPPLLHPPVRA